MSDPWTQQMIEQTDAAEALIGPGDSFEPHDGQESDLNTLTPDLLAEPDEASDPTRTADPAATPDGVAPDPVVAQPAP